MPNTVVSSRQVVEAGIGGIGAKETFHEKGASPVRLALPALGRFQADVLVGGRPGHPALDRSVQAHVVGAGPGPHHHRPGPAQKHAGCARGQVPDALLGPLPQGVVVIEDGVGRHHDAHAGRPGEVAEKATGRRGLLFPLGQSLLGAGGPPGLLAPGGLLRHVAE